MKIRIDEKDNTDIHNSNKHYNRLSMSYQWVGNDRKNSCRLKSQLETRMCKPYQFFTHRPDLELKENNWYSHSENGVGPHGQSDPLQCENEKCEHTLRLEAHSEGKLTHNAGLGH